MLLLDLPPAELAQYRACLDDRPRSKQHFYIYGGLYGLHLLGWLHLGYTGDQCLFVRMASLPRTLEQVARLQMELATFLGLSLDAESFGEAHHGPDDRKASSSRGRERSVCLSATMITAKGQRIRAHNASVREVKKAFRETSVAASLERFFTGHRMLLDALLTRERVHVF